MLPECRGIARSAHRQLRSQHDPRGQPAAADTAAAEQKSAAAGHQYPADRGGPALTPVRAQATATA